MHIIVFYIRIQMYAVLCSAIIVGTTYYVTFFNYISIIRLCQGYMAALEQGQMEVTFHFHFLGFHFLPYWSTEIHKYHCTVSLTSINKI